jgi:hypothetical protein
MNPALAALRHHVSGAIERGEGEAVYCKPVYGPRAVYSDTLGRWYISDDGTTWIALSARVKRWATAMKQARARFGGAA